MPANHGCRSHDPQVIRPATWPYAPEPYPEDSIGSTQAHFRLGPREHLELVAQYQVLED